MAKGEQKGTVAIQTILNASSQNFADIHRRIALLQAIQDKLQTTLPPPLSDNFIIANVSKDTLVLHTQSPAWAAKLRFNTPLILDSVKEFYDTVPPKSLRIKVVPDSPQQAQVQTKRKIGISKTNSQLIKSTAESIKDSSLRESLLKLSRRTR